MSVPATRIPWSFRVFAAAPLPPVWLGAGVALVLVGGFLGLEIAGGSLEQSAASRDQLRLVRGIVVLLVMLAYVPTALLYLMRWTRHNLEALGDLAGGAPPPDDPEAALASSRGRWLGAAGSLAFAFLFLVLPQNPDLPSSRDDWSLQLLVPWLCVPLLGWCIARFALALVTGAQAVSARAQRLRQVDLMDLGALAPFVQQGLGGALLVMLMLAAGAGGMVGQDVVLPSALAMVTALLGVGIAALVLPVLGIRRRIREEKAAQLGALRQYIGADRATVLAGGPDLDRVAARLPGLLALEGRLEAVREWPFRASSLLRFAFYVCLGLGSWLGAALVERGLDVALG